MNRSPFITFDVAFVSYPDSRIKPLHEKATVRTDMIDSFNRIDATKYVGIPRGIKTVVSLSSGNAWLLQESWEDVLLRIEELERPWEDWNEGPVSDPEEDDPVELTEEDRKDLDRWFRRV